MHNQKMNELFLVSIDKTGDLTGIGRQKVRQLVRTEEDLPKIVIGQTTKIILPEFKKWIIKQAEAGRIL